ncbi:MAG: hypothetical protein GY820_16950 [Gammaproteobacteria bacterium]|nr:hypothetical protein [Gammaproteobacteria bacterium]
MSDISEVLSKLKATREEIKELEKQMACSVELENMFPCAQWPVFTSVFYNPQTQEYLFRIRADDKKIKLFPIAEVPRILLQRPHIQKACKTSSTLNHVVNGGIHGSRSFPHNSRQITDKE